MHIYFMYMWLLARMPAKMPGALKNFVDSDNIVLLGRRFQNLRKIKGLKDDTPFSKFKMDSGS